MPISGPASYIPTTAEFLDHWEDANGVLGAAGPLKIRKETVGAPVDVTRAVLDGLYLELLGAHTSIQQVVVDQDLAREGLLDVKSVLLAKMVNFNEQVRALLAGSKYERSLAEVPGITVGQGLFTDPLTGTQALWAQINSSGVLGGSTVLELRDGTTLAQFETLLGTLDPAYRALSRAERTLKLAREDRNDVQDRIYPILKQYRVVVAAMFAPDSAIAEAVPRLTPEQGHTPEPVNASIVWDAAAEKARIVWEASADADLAEYEVRYSPGSEYHEDVEDVLASFAPDAERSFLTDHALLVPGAKALFKVYVILNTGNQSGSSTLAITRP